MTWLGWVIAFFLFPFTCKFFFFLFYKIPRLLFYAFVTVVVCSATVTVLPGSKTVVVTVTAMFFAPALLLIGTMERPVGPAAATVGIVEAFGGAMVSVPPAGDVAVRIEGSARSVVAAAGMAEAVWLKRFAELLLGGTSGKVSAFVGLAVVVVVGDEATGFGDEATGFGEDVGATTGTTTVVVAIIVVVVI